MSSNNFYEIVRNSFADSLEDFEDNLLFLHNVQTSTLGLTPSDLQKVNETVWVRQPTRAKAYSGTNQTGNFQTTTERRVPVTVNRVHSVPITKTTYEVRDADNLRQAFKAASSELATTVNQTILETMVASATVIQTKNAEITSNADIEVLRSRLLSMGIPFDANKMNLALTPASRLGVLADLSSRETLNEMPSKAYKESYVGRVARFQTLEMQYSDIVTGSATTGVTISGANQRHIPRGSVLVGGNEIPVDNRFMNLTVSSSAGLEVGDAFTIAGVFELHIISRKPTTTLKTFRIVDKPSAGVITISPAIVDGSHIGAIDPEKQYANVSATPADGAAIALKNIATVAPSIFWHHDACVLIPSKIPVNASGLGREGSKIVATMTIKPGLAVVLSADTDINTLDVKFRFDVYYGFNVINPEMVGLYLPLQV